LLAEHTNLVSPPFTIPYSEDPNSDFYKMIKQVYDVSQTLTTDQRNIALFWQDVGNGVGYTPYGHHFLIVTQVIEQTGASLGLAAEAYAKAGIAIRDATIVCFRSKYANNLIRPVSYIRSFINSNWLPLFATPSHPEYPAAHAFLTSAVTQATARVIGENVPVTDYSLAFRGLPVRTFPNLAAVGQDAGQSRNYAGIHYLISINVGRSMGLQIGNRVGDIKLTE
jgi:hypothetical protein